MIKYSYFIQNLIVVVEVIKIQKILIVNSRIKDLSGKFLNAKNLGACIEINLIIKKRYIFLIIKKEEKNKME